jgi:hypothetical protein
VCLFLADFYLFVSCEMRLMNFCQFVWHLNWNLLGGLLNFSERLGGEKLVISRSLTSFWLELFVFLVSELSYKSSFSHVSEKNVSKVSS